MLGGELQDSLMNARCRKFVRGCNYLNGECLFHAFVDMSISKLTCRNQILSVYKIKYCAMQLCYNDMAMGSLRL